MNITKQHKNQLGKLIYEHTNADLEQSYDYSLCDEFWEITDETVFKDIMGKETPITPENILKYYEKFPEELEVIKDIINEDYELKTWNVNAWRNS